MALPSSFRPVLTACLVAAAWPAGAVPAPAAAASAAPAAPAPGVAWQEAADDADVAQAFAHARAEHKPLLLYWGAKWCPPCNQLKATLFNRADFIERSHAFVAVHIDGDARGAQKLGTRFKVRGYPTLILFHPDGQEITRLPGEIDAPQVMQVLQLGLSNGRPVAQVLADARAGKPLAPNEWRLLAYYSWDTDEQALVPQAERAALLAKLAAAAPTSEPDVAMRLQFKALAESVDTAEASKAALPRPDPHVRERVLHLLADPAASRAQMDALTNVAPEIAKALSTDPAQRDALVQALDGALQRLQADPTLSRADRVSALYERVALARLRAGIPDDATRVKLPEALVHQVRDEAAREDREITDGYERQAVITTAAQALELAGDGAGSDALLKANLTKSHSPYYLMLDLAGNARSRGDKAGALHWYQAAFEKSEGPATRLQWGAAYIGALVDLSPQDAPRIEQAVDQLWDEAAAQPDNAFYERNARSLQRVGDKLQAWSKGGRHAEVMKRLQAKLDGVCARLDAADPHRATCDGLLKPQAAKA